MSSCSSRDIEQYQMDGCDFTQEARESHVIMSDIRLTTVIPLDQIGWSRRTLVHNRACHGHCTGFTRDSERNSMDGSDPT